MTSVKQNHFWTFRYALINITYFMVFCGIHAYSSVFLLSKGFSNTLIGLTLASANIISVLLQPLVAGWIDRPGPLTNRRIAMASTLILIFGSVLLILIKNSTVAIFLIFGLIYMVQMAYQPLIIAMNFEYAQAGCNINFGLCRGLGSAGFAVFSAVIGNFVTGYGVNVLMYSDIVVLVIAFFILLTFRKPQDNGELVDNHSDTDKEAHNNIIEFARLYPKFMLFLVGVVFFFFPHNMINDYLIQIITPLGGNETQMGYAIFIAALLELPAMALVSVFLKRLSCETLLKISAVMFLVKILLITCAKSIIGVYISEICQIGAYALLIPVAAYYVNKKMDELDQVKGQAFINSAITLGGVFSGLICGRLLDLCGPKVMLIIGSIATAIGTVIVFISVSDLSRKN